MQNLDLIAAQTAPLILPNIANEKKEPLINKALGILAEQGPFAMMLWARSQGEGNIGSLWRGHLSAMLRQTGLFVSETEDYREWLANFNTQVCGDFVKLMMTRQLFERVLIYARHYAKAE